MTPASADILAALRNLCGETGARVTVAQVASEAGCSARTVRRALADLQTRGVVTVHPGGGRGVETTASLNPDRPRNRERLSEIPNRIYDDPADMTPGAEYTPIPPGAGAAVAADRARMYHARFGRWPSWARMAP